MKTKCMSNQDNHLHFTTKNKIKRLKKNPGQPKTKSLGENVYKSHI